MGVHVALLRAINLAGTNRVPMKSLAAMFVDAGCADVRTYIQSGNVVFRAGNAVARRVPAAIAAAIEKQLGLRVPLVIRTAAEMADVAESNPFLAAGLDAGTLHVSFLGDAPAAAKVAALDPNRSPGDKFAVRGREIYLHCPNGVGKTKLTNQYFESRLGTLSTARNWRTVLTLLEMAAGA
jgi:uncharacterized protein (DUF1697 family)